eukprot:4982122-Amphidinium_carterae.1
MVGLMIKQGWVDSWQELLEGRMDVPAKRKPLPSLAAASSSSAAAAQPQAAASSTDQPMHPKESEVKPSGHSDAVHQTRQKLQALRSRCKNTLDWCGRLMLDTDLRAYVRMLHEGSRPIHEAYVHETRVVRDVHERQDHAVKQSSGAWLATLRSTLEVLHNCGTLERCGIACEELSLRRLQSVPDEASFHAMLQHERCLHLT